MSEPTLPERLETPRLILRRPIAEDADAIFARYATDPEVVRFLSWRAHANVEETRAFIASQSAAWDRPSDADRFLRSWSILGKDEGRLMGMIAMRIGGFRAEAGYVLAKPHWGAGFTTEALVAVRDATLALPAIHRIQIVCDVDNPASARVMEKAGFEREGVLRRRVIAPNLSAAPRDCLCYSLVR